MKADWCMNQYEVSCLSNLAFNFISLLGGGLQECFPAARQVDNTKFTMECVEPAIHVYELHENKWRCKDPHV